MPFPGRSRFYQRRFACCELDCCKPHYTNRNGRLNWLVSVIAFTCSQRVIDCELDLGLTCPWPSTSTIGSF